MATATYNIPAMPFFLQKKPGDGDPIVYSAADFRRYTAALNRRPGTLGPGDFVVDQGLNVGWKILVNSGYAHVGTGTAHYIVTLAADQEINLTGFTTSPAAKRTHKVYLAVFDALSAGTGYEAQIVVTEDTGTGAPTPPNAVAYLELATFTISPGQSNIQRTHISNAYAHGGDISSWINLAAVGALTPGFTSSQPEVLGTNSVFQARYQGGGIVRLSGAIGRTDGLPFAAGASYVVATLPVTTRLRPAYTRILAVPCGITEPHTTTSGYYVCRLRVDPDGTMTIQMPVAQSPYYIFFDGVTYDLD